jgi:hypothetical protein
LGAGQLILALFIAVSLSFIFAGLLVFGGFRLHLVLIEHNPLWWLWIIPITIWGLSIVFIVAWYSLGHSKP